MPVRSEAGGGTETDTGTAAGGERFGEWWISGYYCSAGQRDCWKDAAAMRGGSDGSCDQQNACTPGISAGSLLFERS